MGSHFSEKQIALAAAAIGNARGMRRGVPPITNLLDALPAGIRSDLLEDAAAALEAVLADASTPEALKREAEELGLGATGDYPMGKIARHDEGQLKVALAVERQHGRLVVNFGKPIVWIAMTRGEATVFANALRQKADELR